MQSAFVNIGGIKDGFLYLDDPAAPRLGSDLTSEEEGEEAAIEDLPPPPPRCRP